MGNSHILEKLHHGKGALLIFMHHVNFSALLAVCIIFFFNFVHIFMSQCLKFQEDPSEKSNEQDDKSRAKSKDEVLIFINIIFTILFSIECFLKLLAFGIKVCEKEIN
jgi:hypothetical protein